MVNTHIKIAMKCNYSICVLRNHILKIEVYVNYTIIWNSKFVLDHRILCQLFYKML